MKILGVLVAALVLTGCASLNSLPRTASDVTFDGERGKTGWAEHRNNGVFQGYDADQVFEAAKVGLEQSGFAVKRADRARGMVLGEHGITLVDWNIVAGVYFQEVGADTRVHVVSEGSKDVGIAGDATAADWPGQIPDADERLLMTEQGVVDVVSHGHPPWRR